MPSKTKDSSYRNLNSNAAPQLKEPLLSNTSESHDHGHSHAHSHGHQHEHKHDHNHSHGHGHSHDHGHSHHHIVEMTQKQPCNPCPKHAKLLKEQQQQKSESDTIKVPIHSQLGNSQGHDHGHSHGHSHDHDHDHKHNDQDSDSDSHDHSHSHSHSHDHDHDHNHSDDDHHHDRDSTTSNPLASKSHSEITKLKRAMFFAFFFMLVEIFGGLYANSIAIITDAAHMLSDVGGLFVSLFALQLSAGVTSLNNKKKKEKKSIIKHGEEHTVKKRSDSKLATFFLDYTFGYGQAEVVGAFLSILLVWLLTGGLIIEAVQRLQQPEEIDGKLMFWIASLGLVVNLILLKVLGHDHGDGGDGHSHGHSHGHFHSHGHGHAHGSNSGSGGSGGESNNSLALDAALLHVIGDIVQSVGVMLAAGLIWWQPIDIGHSDTGMRKKEYTTVNDGKDTVITEIPVMVSNWNYADPLCTFLFAILVLFTTKGTVKGILSQVMMRTPSYIDCKTLLIDLEEYDPRVICVHDLHVWSVGSTPCLTCHCVIGPNSKREDAGEVLRNLTKKVVLEKYGIEHSTIQIEVKGDYDHIVEEKYGGLGCGHNLGTKGVGCCK